MDETGRTSRKCCIIGFLKGAFYMSDFKIGQREQESVSVLELKGYLDAHTAPKLEEALQSLLKSRALQYCGQLQRTLVYK